VKVVEINGYADFLGIKEKWNDMLQKCTHTIFSTWEWLSTWWKYFGSDKELMLLLAEENGKIIGIAPLMYSVHKMFGLRRGKIEFIGAPSSDYNDFIIAKNYNECIELFIEHLNKIPEKWSCIDLLDIPERAKYLPFLAKISKILKRVHECPFIPLPSSYEDFLRRFNSGKRKYFRKNLNRIERAFDVEFVDYSSPELCGEGMRLLFDLHQKRWASKGFAGAFAYPKFRDFHLEIAKTFAQKNWLSLYALKLSGEIAAVDYGFKYNSKCCSYLTGFDPKYAYYSVGNILRLLIIRRLVREGQTEFDFLRGAEEYKYKWNALPRWNYQAVLTRKGRLANIQHWLYEQYWRQGNRLKYVLKIR
jgi:CelD/BcsL family acetyltransferase involved in cellulose biosynthesis